jgi:bifunctional non-homologous end joining protein LigD
MTRQELPDWVEAAWVDPQLATLTKDRFSDPAWIYERKLDGERCIAYGRGGEVQLATRNQKSANGAYPELAEALASQETGDFIVDGEVVSLERGQTSFALLQQRIHVEHPSDQLRARIPVYYYLFDIMSSGGTDVRDRPLLERKELLRRQFGFADPLRFTEHRSPDGEAYFQQACRDGWEGLIAKRADAPYVAGRAKDWLKFKCQSGQEFVIGGYTDPQGTRTDFGALLLGYYDTEGRLVYAGKVGTGFDRALLHDLHGEMARIERDTPPFQQGKPPTAGVHWVEPRLVGEVGFSEWTSAGELRHPRFEGLRRDKAATEVVKETPEPA